jgi:DNA-binding protein HU-beta
MENHVNKMQLIEAVARELGVPVPRAAESVDAVLDAIVRAVVAGDKVTVTGFGTFDRMNRAARLARNPQTGDPVKVEATAVPRFRAGQGFKDLTSGARKLPKRGPVVRKAAKGSLIPAQVKAARLEAERKAAAQVIAGRRVAGQTGAR